MLFTFLARQMAKHSNTIMVNRVLFEQVLESLCASGEDSRHEERHQALLELLHAGGLQHFDEDHLILMADEAKFFRVCETMHERRGHYHRILSCYWRDAARQMQIFAYISKVLTDGNVANEQKQLVKDELLRNLEHLVKIDARKTAKLVLVTLNCPPSEAVKHIAGNEDMLFDFLQGVFTYREGSVVGGEDVSKKSLKLEPEIYERYLELMCLKAPQNVCYFLRSDDSYRLQESLEICQRHRVTDAIAYLLERSGDIQGAFDLLMGELMRALKDEKRMEVKFDKMYNSIGVIIQLLQRNSHKLDQSQREGLWFPLLERVLAEQREATRDQDGFDWKSVTRQVINAMMAYIPLSFVLQKVMSDPVYSMGRFGEMKDLLLGMLDTYNYEKTLLNTCANLINHDLHCQLTAFTASVGRAVVLRTDHCLLCSKTIGTLNSADSVVCFQCGHSFHCLCLSSVTAVNLSSEEAKRWACFVCAKSSVRTQSSVKPSSGLLNAAQKSSPAKLSENLADEAQSTAIENLRQSQKCPSRLAILSELVQRDRAGGKSNYRPYGYTSILQHEHFPLRVTAPPPP